MDIGCCLMAAPVLAIATLMAALVMKLVAPGPVFFRQERVGYKGRRFRLYKFRTMYAGADTAIHQAHFSQFMQANAPMQKLDARGDSRLIPGGWLWRATGLDELPQILNVLRGEMSLIGPRPCVPYEYAAYSAAQRERLSCVPGLTGLWQVSGKNRTTFDEMVQFDIAYARRRSVALDLWIMLRTLPALWVQVCDMRNTRRSAISTEVGSIVPATTRL